MADILQDNPRSSDPKVTNATGDKRLFYLHDLKDFKVHHDDPDVRGWSVQLDGGTTVGKVENLVVDKMAQLVRYLEVDADRNFSKDYSSRTYLDTGEGTVFDADSDEHFIVPVGMSRLDLDNHIVYLTGVDSEVIGNVPRYRRGSEIKPRYEYDTVNYYADQRPQYAEGYDRKHYMPDVDDPDTFTGLNDQFYTSSFFDRDTYYDRHQRAISSSGL